MKNRGFTLVELLGVIVVLAIIALIAVPTIIGVIDKSRKGALQNSGYGLVEAGTLYNAQYQNKKTVRFDIKNNEVTSEEENKLTYKGNVKEGTVLVSNKGEVVVCINDGKYAAYKNFKDNKITIVDNKTCNIPENSNIVYLDNEATVDTNIDDLIARIEALEKDNKAQKEEIETLKSEKASSNDLTSSINNLTSTHNTDVASINNRLSDITSILNKKDTPVLLLDVTPNTTTTAQQFPLTDAYTNYDIVVMQVFYTYYCIAEFTFQPSHASTVWKYSSNSSSAGHIIWNYVFGNGSWTGIAEFNSANTLSVKNASVPPDQGISIKIIGYKKM